MKQKNTYEFYHNTSKLKVLKSKENLLFKIIKFLIKNTDQTNTTTTAIQPPTPPHKY